MIITPDQMRDLGPEALQKVKAELARRSFAEYVRQAWPIIEPGTPLVWGWVIDAICEHLEACSEGDIKRLVINVPPGPMRDDSLVTTSSGRKQLKDVEIGDMVLTHKGRYRPVSAVHHQGTLPILQITTNSGRVTHAAPSHPYLTPRGWVEAGKLQVGDFAAVVSPEEERTEQHCTPAEARLMGYMVGDGSLIQSAPIFTNRDLETIIDLQSCLDEIGFEYTTKMRKSHWSVSVRGGQPVRDYFESFGLMGKSSYTKRIPDQILNSDAEIMRNFLGAYWSCDGMISVRASRKRGSVYRASCTTVSEQLADDLLHLCGMLGIRARIRKKSRKLETSAQPGGVYRSFNLEVQREVDTARFADLPGLCARKRVLAEKCRKSFDQALWEDEIVEILQVEDANCMCLTVDEDHSFVCSDIAVKNSMKSKLTSVLWPTWNWTSQGHLKFLSSSYALNLAERNNVEARRILQSEWYTNTFGVGISTEEGGKVNFSNDKHGVMRAISVGGATTGYRGDMFIIDDPHDVSKAESDAKRTEAVTWFMESAQNRLNSLVDSVIVVVMQRVHEEDVSSIALEMGYDHLCIPMRWEEDLRKTTAIGWTDPRSEDGELMWPERFPKKELDQLEANMGPYATAAQNQQRPAPRKGGMFAVDKIQQIDELPDEPFIEVRAWDFAGSEGKGAYSVGVKMLFGLKSKDFIIADVSRGQWGGGKVREQVKTLAEDDGIPCGIVIPQDPGAAGKVVAEDYVAMLTGYSAHIEIQSGSKELRAEPFAAQVEINRVKILKRLWTKPFLDELRFFPKAKLKDQVDAASSAFNRLAVLSRRNRQRPTLTLVGGKQENTAAAVG